MRFYHEASELAACGFHVFPIHSLDDRGVLRHRASDDPAYLSVLDRLYPAADVAVVLGERSDVLLVHVSQSGFAELRALEAIGLHVPDCPVSQSSDGDATLWFRNLSGFRGVRTVAPGLTALSEGEVWRAPPSRDRTNGQWTWVVAPWQIRPPVVPDWLVARLVPFGRIRSTLRKYASNMRLA